MATVNGQCSCGVVGFKLTTNELRAYQCHCSICRKASGSAFSTTLLAPEAGFVWLRGVEQLTAYKKASGYQVNFCSRCGSPVPNRFRDQAFYCVPLGSLDGLPDVTIAAQLHLNSRARWDKDAPEGRKFSEMPSMAQLHDLLHVSA